MKSSTIRFVSLLVAILAVGAMVNTWSYLGEAHVERKELKNFPAQIGQWEQRGTDQVLDAATLEVLRASDYLLRDYRRPDGQLANFYVGYYATQRDGASFHSPLNCLPGSGWILSEPGSVTLTKKDGTSFTANKFVIQNGDSKSLMIYWYEGRGRSISSEYWGKIYTVVDSVKMRRSDAAMVRVTVPVIDSEAIALESASQLAVETLSVLGDYVPS